MFFVWLHISAGRAPWLIYVTQKIQLRPSKPLHYDLHCQGKCYITTKVFCTLTLINPIIVGPLGPSLSLMHTHACTCWITQNTQTHTQRLPHMTKHIQDALIYNVYQNRAITMLQDLLVKGWSTHCTYSSRCTIYTWGPPNRCLYYNLSAYRPRSTKQVFHPFVS